MVHPDLDLFFQTLLFNRFQGIKFPGPTSGAFFTSPVPIFWRPEVAVPEWPRFALCWSGVVKFTLSGSFVEENAVVIW